MKNSLLAAQIHYKALECGYDGCGIIPISDLDEYQSRLQERIKLFPHSKPIYNSPEEFCRIRENYPWAKSAIVCTVWLGKYRYPESLQGKYAKHFVLSADDLPDSNEYQNKRRFEAWLSDANIRFIGGETNLPGKILPLRLAAVKAGLGIFRRNNFFYGEKGSYYALEGYLIDADCEYRNTHEIRPCSEKCNLCQQACKTHALCAPYTMDPTLCVSFLTTFAGGAVPPHLQEENLGTWICGCDACQDACPYNRRHDWSSGEEFFGLDGITELMEPENILAASDEELRVNIIPRTDHHIPPEQVNILRVNAKRAGRYKCT